MASDRPPFPRRSLSRSLSRTATHWEHSVEDESYAGLFLGRLGEIWDKKQYCDITLVVENEKIDAHRIVLMAFSEYFKGLFKPNTKEASLSEIELPCVPLEDFKALLGYAYSGKIRVTYDNVESLMGTANYYGVDFVCQACCDCLLKNIDADNCLAILQLGDIYSQDELKEKARKYVLTYFSKVMKADDFLEIEALQLDSLLQDERLLVTVDDVIPDASQSENTIVDAILRWAAHKNERSSSLPKLLSHVRLPLLSSDRLKELDVRLSSAGSKTCEDLMLDVALPPRHSNGLRYRSGPMYADSYQLRHCKVGSFNFRGAIETCTAVSGMDIYIRRWDGRPVLGGLCVYFSDGSQKMVGDDVGPDKYSFTLEENERIIRVELSSGWLIDRMTFTTNTGRQMGPYGGEGGGERAPDRRADGTFGYLAGIRGDIIVDQGSKSLTRVHLVWAEYYENLDDLYDSDNCSSRESRSYSGSSDESE